jgi:hypothetical protein
MKAINIFLTVFFISVLSHANAKLNNAFSVKDTTDNDKMDQAFKNKYVLAESYIITQGYLKAIILLKQLDSIMPSNSNINYKLGLCYYNTTTDKKSTISCFEKAVKKIDVDYKSAYNETSAPPAAYYYLAKTYHSEYKFSDAIKYFEKFKTYLSKNESKTLKDINHNIEMCENGIKMMKSELNPQIEVLDAEINSQNTNYSLLASNDNTVLLYSSIKNNLDNKKSNEDISYYYTVLDGKKWSPPVKLGNDFNIIPTDVSSKLFSKKKEIYITKNDNGVKELYCVSWKDDKWSDPVKVGPNINSKASIYNACVSPDGSTLFFSSNKDGGYGGYDIYACERLSDGNWSDPKNLGPNVNTPYDDISPYIANDGVTLYFSSQGHNSIGGFDVFFTTLSDDGLWSLSENIGYPINTPLDDLFYIPSSDATKAFYSSSKEGRIGDNDIYFISYSK